MWPLKSRSPHRTWNSRENGSGNCAPLDDVELLSDLPERVHGAVEVGALVRGGDLAAQARLAVRDGGVAEAGHVNALFEERLAHRERLRGVTDDDGNDGVSPVRDPEAGFGDRLPEVSRVVAELAHGGGVLAQHPERLERARRDGWGQGVGEE